MPLPSLRGMAVKALAAVADRFAGPARIPTRGGPPVAGGPWQRYGGAGADRVRWFLPGATFDWEKEAGDLWSNPVIALGLQWMGDRVARPKLKVGKYDRRGDLVEIPRHGLVDLWTRPNPHYGRRTLEKACLLDLKVDGNAYIYKLRDNAGRVRQLWWIPHFRCRPLWPADGSQYADGFRLSIDGRNVDVPAADVIHVRDGIDPRDERRGLAPAKACVRDVCVVNGESGHTASVLKNAGVPAVALVPRVTANGMAPSIDPALALQMKEKFQDEMGGDDANGVVVFSDPYEVVTIGFSPEQLALDKLPQNAIARVAASIGPNAMSLGLPDPNKTYANLAEANRASWGALVASQELIAEAIRDDLTTEVIQFRGKVTPASEPLDLVVWYDYSGIQELGESLDSQHMRTREDFKAGIVTKNEAREAIGLEAHPDGDVFFGEGAAAEDDPEPDDQVDDDQDGDEKSEPKGTKAWRYY